MDRLQFNEMITVLSRLEATGMAREVEYNVDHHREQTINSAIRLAAP